ncbi:hypothetical protein TIFTF001_019977 [Ficus carica]|uniref:Uncharacterized protein n=1 Tax=Ficus carica TaxID=3494 RepID=A0AA88A9U7_FICCA|nr:hypothetical protein TIFTF001_019977 [Ficus carica]
MFSAKPSTSRKRRAEPELADLDQAKRSAKDLDLDFDLDLDLSRSAIESLMVEFAATSKALCRRFSKSETRLRRMARRRTRRPFRGDFRKILFENWNFVAAEIKSMIDELKSKFEKDRQNLAKALSKSSKEFENSLKNETVKFQSFYQNFSKEKATHLQALKDTISKFEEEKERLFTRYEQLRKKEKSVISEHEKACADKIAQLEDSLRNKTKDEKTFSILRKTLGSFLNNGSDEDFPPDD